MSQFPPKFTLLQNELRNNIRNAWLCESFERLHAEFKRRTEKAIDASKRGEFEESTAERFGAMCIAELIAEFGPDPHGTAPPDWNPDASKGEEST